MHWFSRAEVVSLFKKKKRQQEDLLGAPFDCICCTIGADAVGWVGSEFGESEKKTQTFLPNTRKNRSEKKNKKKSLTPIQSNTNGSWKKKRKEKKLLGKIM